MAIKVSDSVKYNQPFGVKFLSCTVETFFWERSSATMVNIPRSRWFAFVPL